MLGSVSEAEDVVQEGFLRLHRAREGYVGEWLPEPLVASADDDPARKVEMADSLSLAFLVLLESLSPEQRAAFLLHEVFDEPYDRIAEIVGTSEQNARQLAARFFAAAEEGDLEGLEELLAHDVVLRGDGGGKAPALARALHGRARVARTLIAGLRALTRFGITSRREEVNGQPGALFLDREGRLISVMSLDIAEGQIQGVSAIVNPDKLRHLGPLADLSALLDEWRSQRGRTERERRDDT